MQPRIGPEGAREPTNFPLRVRNLTAVLGPTNTGKTHLAIERMLSHESGIIGLPLRLLAREVYDKVVARVGPGAVALITGEEKIKPENPRYWVSTVEAMPLEVEADFVAVDEIQLAADPERGHVFTHRLINARGNQETLLLGAQTMRETIAELLSGANFITRPRLSRLTFAGAKKISRLPRRSAVVAFSASDVYAIAELIRRQRGGAAVVLGALSPRTRNAQVALYQAGEVDFLVATDAIGMGLNLDVDHVAFAQVRKFDGLNHRNLTPVEIGQIAGRAGRHMNDGTFGVTGDVEPFDSTLIERLENHQFEPVKQLQWRNANLDFASLDALRESLQVPPRHHRLRRARLADDVIALEALARDPEIRALAGSPAAVARLWEVCQIPDYRKISAANHAELIATIYRYLLSDRERVPEDWIANQVARSDRTDGDIDTLANRLAHVRTWTFVSNRADWLEEPAYWQERTREIEDRLSDALHERLTRRFVDKRTSALMRRMRDREELSAEIGGDGAMYVEKHYVGRLNGFRYIADAAGEGIHGKAARSAAAKVLVGELSMRARRVAAARPEALSFGRDGEVFWRGEVIARIEAGDDPLSGRVQLLADEHLTAPDRARIEARLEAWFSGLREERLKPLLDMTRAEDLSGLARGIAYRLKEGYGILKREDVAEEVRELDQPARATLRRFGVRFGAFNIYFPALLKPAASELLVLFWRLHNNGCGLPEPPRAGLTSVAADPAIPEAYYRVAGYHLCGGRAVRIDILERLSDLIRPLVNWRAKEGADAEPPAGATGDGGFAITPAMMSILGCSAEQLGEVLRALGFRSERRPLAPGDGEATAAAKARAAAEPDNSAGKEGEKETEEEKEKQGQEQTAVESHAEAAGTEADGAGAPQWEIIWRPRRRAQKRSRAVAGRGRRQGSSAGDQRQQPTKTKRSTTSRKSVRQAPGGDGPENRAHKPHDRHSREGEARRRDDGKPSRRPPKPKRKRPEIDPDSPFAALSELKEKLERQASDKPSP